MTDRISDARLRELIYHWDANALTPFGEDTVAALRELLAAREQQPVAWRFPWDEDGWYIVDSTTRPPGTENVTSWQPLYAAPVVAAQDDRRDAERYRWLRKQNDERGCIAGIWYEAGDVAAYPYGDEADALIDAARARGGSDEPLPAVRRRF